MTFSDGISTVQWLDDAFWMVGRHGLIATSEDGSSWDTRKFDLGVEYAGIATNGEIIVAVGARKSGQYGALVATSSDGYIWNEIEIWNGANYRISSVTWTGTRFVGVGNNGSIFRSDDGFQWEFDQETELD